MSAPAAHFHPGALPPRPSPQPITVTVPFHPASSLPPSRLPFRISSRASPVPNLVPSPPIPYRILPDQSSPTPRLLGVRLPDT